MPAGGTHQYTYDDAGNLRTENTDRKYEWDARGRMRSFRNQVSGSQATVFAHYTYDGGGQRVQKVVSKDSGKPVHSVYIGGIFEHHERIDGGSVDAEVNHLHVMDDQKRVAIERVGSELDGSNPPTTQYHLGDHLQSSNVVLDGTGTLFNREEYRPFGESSFGSYDTKRYRFTGQERDEESSLSYHGARYYAPWTAQWTSPDPKGMVDGTNLYGYSRNNPVNRRDPTGQDSYKRFDSDKLAHAFENRSFLTSTLAETLRETRVYHRRYTPEAAQHVETPFYNPRIVLSWFDLPSQSGSLSIPRAYLNEIAKNDAESIPPIKFGILVEETVHAYNHRALQGYSGYSQALAADLRSAKGYYQNQLDYLNITESEAARHANEAAAGYVRSKATAQQHAQSLKNTEVSNLDQIVTDIAGYKYNAEVASTQGYFERNGRQIETGLEIPSTLQEELDRIFLSGDTPTKPSEHPLIREKLRQLEQKHGEGFINKLEEKIEGQIKERYDVEMDVNLSTGRNSEPQKPQD